MNTKDADIDQILENDRAWLAQQHSMQPWDEGCLRLATLLDTRLQRYSMLVRERPLHPKDGDRSTYVARLWQCLGYHWRDALELSPSDDPPSLVSLAICNPDAGQISVAAQPSANGHITAEQVAERIAAGLGYRRGGKLGGDPLRDVVLAVAMVRRDQRAPRVFRDDYFSFACALAAKIHKCLIRDPDPWWSELLDHLAGYSRPSAKLDRFCGRCALQNWLGTVIWNFLRRWRFGANQQPELDEPVANPAVPSESLEIFRKITRQAADSLSSDDRLLLTLLYIDGLKNKQAAGILNVSEGTASKRHQRIILDLNASILQIASRELSSEACAGLFEDMYEHPRIFAIALREALESEVIETVEADLPETFDEDEGSLR